MTVAIMMMTIVIICMMVIMTSTTTMMSPYLLLHKCTNHLLDVQCRNIVPDGAWFDNSTWTMLTFWCNRFFYFWPKKGRFCLIFCDSFLFRRSRTCSRAQNQIIDNYNLEVLSLSQLTFWRSRTCSKAPSPHHRRWTRCQTCPNNGVC